MVTLLQEQRNPTMESVREYLGGTGSFATLSKHLNTWRQSRLLASTQTNLSPFSPPDEVNQAVSHVWQQLNEKAQQEIAKFKLEQQTQFEALTATNDRLATENSQSYMQLKQLDVENSQLQADNTLLQQALTEERKQKLLLNEQLSKKIATLEAIIQEKEIAVELLCQQTEKRVSELQALYQSEQQSHQAEIDKMLSYQEAQRQSYILEIDKAKVFNRQFEKVNVQLTIDLKQNKQQITVLEEKCRGHAVDVLTLQQTQRVLVEEKNEYLLQRAHLESVVNQGQMKNEALLNQLSFLQQTILQKLEVLQNISQNNQARKEKK